MGSISKLSDGQALAITSMYASRVPLSSSDELIGMLASAGVTEGVPGEGSERREHQGLTSWTK
jgi:hypothetical protein